MSAASRRCSILLGRKVLCGSSPRLPTKPERRILDLQDPGYRIGAQLTFRLQPILQVASMGPPTCNEQLVRAPCHGVVRQRRLRERAVGLLTVSGLTLPR